TRTYTLSLHDALPISWKANTPAIGWAVAVAAYRRRSARLRHSAPAPALGCNTSPQPPRDSTFVCSALLISSLEFPRYEQHRIPRSEEHTSELQSPCNL